MLSFRRFYLLFSALPVMVLLAMTAPTAQVGEPPTALDDLAEVSEDGAVSIDVLANDRGAAGRHLVVASIAQPSNGTVTTDGQRIMYVPTANFHGVDTFLYTMRHANSSSRQATARVTVTVTPVNDAPAATSDKRSTAEDTALSLSLAGTDVDGDALTFQVTAGPAHGVLSGSAPDLVYTPAENFHGDDSFAFVVNDGHVTSSPGILALQVTPVNDAPSAVAQDVATAEDVPMSVTLAGKDIDGDTLTFRIVQAPDHGTVTGEFPNLRYIPAANFSGMDRLQFVANDGSLDSTAAVISIEVTPVNDAPSVTLAAEPLTGRAPLTVRFTAEATDVDTPSLSHTWSFGDGPSVQGAPIQSHIYNSPGRYTAKLTVSDGHNSADASVEVQVSAGSDTPDAPSLDPRSALNFRSATEFLYAGADPIQKGVAADTIDIRRAAVVRGRVLDRSGSALPGVKITVHDQPEFGHTLTRADGMFDLAVNGGGVLTVQYEKEAFLPAHRQVHAPWQDFTFAPDVVLAQLDSQVTLVEFAPNAPTTVARGSVITDADGSRQATLIFQGATMVNMELPDGTTLPAQARLHVRATEYTVGATGPQSMPADLPPTSGYTYAVELSADEAFAAGARKITFDPAVIFYLENFLEFPVGSPVPAGYYDREKAAWVPSRNGRVIKILSITSDVANIDANGDGAVDSAASLAALGVTTAERQKLASLYVVGQSLWRVPITHFTPLDCNWPYGPPPGAEAPEQSVPDPDPIVPDPECKGGSIIECQNQVLRERIGVVGTPFTLNYRSDRVPGRRAAYTLDIPLSGATIPASLKRIELDIRVAGRRFTKSFAPTPRQRYTFAWDGNDAYGRPVPSAVPATVRIGYVYGLVYQEPALVNGVLAFDASFARISGVPYTVRRDTREMTLWQQLLTHLGTTRAHLAGWSLSGYHAYDPMAKILHLGDGSRREAQALPAIITTVAGNLRSNGPGRSSGDGGSATQAYLNLPFGLAVAPDGSLYIAEVLGARIRRVGPDGIITTVAGTGSTGFSGDGGSATQAQLNAPRGIAIGVDGSLYIADTGNRRIRRIGLDGVITTIAGNGNLGSTGDGGPATQATFIIPHAVAVAPDGSVYVVENNASFIRRIGLDGIITTVAGHPSVGLPGDRTPATLAHLSTPSGIAVAQDGTFYIADLGNWRIARVGPDGILITVAGVGNAIFNGDGLPARQTSVIPSGVAVAPDGSIYITDGHNRIRRIGPDGIVTTVAGNGAFGVSGDGGPATQAALAFNGQCLGAFWCYGSSVAVGPDGSLYIADIHTSRIRRVTPALPTLRVDEIAIASEDGAEFYVFSGSGRHLRTLDALTGAMRYQFTHDSTGQLVSITDGDGNVTSIEWANGSPAAIMAPARQRTTLTVDANGYLASIANPAGEAYQVSYTAEGLLTTFRDPNGHSSVMTYDSLGRLSKDQNAANGFWLLERTEQPNRYSASMTSAESRTFLYQVERLSTGAERRTNTAADGTTTQLLRQSNGTRTATALDGTFFTSTEAADPRFGMQSPFTTATTVRLPSGLTAQVTATRNVALAQPGNPFSVVTQTTDAKLNGRLFRSVYDGALRQQTLTTPTGRQSFVRIDDHGRPVMEQVPGVEPLHYSYDARGRLTGVSQGSGANARSVTFEYNAQGYLASATDSLGRAQSFTYDDAGRLIRQTFGDGRIIQYSYDANGNLTSLTPPSRPAHTFAYTPVNLQEQYTPPTGAPAVMNYVYNRDGQLTQVNRPDGQAITFAYDLGSRVTRISTPSSERRYAYDSSGRMSGIAGASGQLQYTFDGPLPLTEIWSGLVSGTVSRTYNGDLLPSAVSVNGSSISLAYDNDGLLVQAGALTLQRSAINGFVTGTSIGGTHTTVQYNSFGEVARLTASHMNAPLLDIQYIRDAAGRVSQQVEMVAGQGNTISYSYDDAGRLRGITMPSGSATYAYDANGNRITHNGVTSTYDTEDRLLTYGMNRYTYTAAGELATKTANGQTTQYVYDVLGNLTAVILPDGTVIQYAADGRNRRIKKTVNGVAVHGYLYEDALRPVAELDGANNIVSRFVYATRVNVPEYMVKAGQTYRILTDQLGSPRIVVNTTTGEIAQRLDYDALGNVIVDTNPGFQPFGFAGGLYDQHTKLVRFGARDYDPEIGRWTIRDPIMFEGGTTNVYAYASNDPVNWHDSNGLSEEHASKTGTDLVDMTVWLFKDSPMARAEKLAFVGVGNVAAQIGATIAEICISPLRLGGVIKVQRFGEDTTIWRQVQEGFNDVYRHILHLPIPDREAEARERIVDEWQRRLNDSTLPMPWRK